MSESHVDTIAAGDALVAAVTAPYIKIFSYITNDPTLDSTDWFLYGTLCKYLAISRKRGAAVAYPGQETLARECRVSVDTIQRRVAKLEARGWIRRHRRGFGTTTRYEVLGPAVDDATHGSGVTVPHSPQIADTADCGVRSRNLRSKTPQTAASYTASVRHKHNEVEHNEQKQDEGEHFPPTPHGGKTRQASSGALLSELPATPKPRKAARRELDDPYWQGAAGAERRRRFELLLAQHPRKDGQQPAMRAWREVLGADADDAALLQIVMAAHEEATWTWLDYTAGMEPRLSTWLYGRDWEFMAPYVALMAPREAATPVEDDGDGDGDDELTDDWRPPAGVRQRMVTRWGEAVVATGTEQFFEWHLGYSSDGRGWDDVWEETIEAYAQQLLDGRRCQADDDDAETVYEAEWAPLPWDGEPAASSPGVTLDEPPGDATPPDKSTPGVALDDLDWGDAPLPWDDEPAEVADVA